MRQIQHPIQLLLTPDHEPCASGGLAASAPDAEMPDADAVAAAAAVPVADAAAAAAATAFWQTAANPGGGPAARPAMLPSEHEGPASAPMPGVTPARPLANGSVSGLHGGSPGGGSPASSGGGAGGGGGARMDSSAHDPKGSEPEGSSAGGPQAMDLAGMEPEAASVPLQDLSGNRAEPSDPDPDPAQGVAAGSDGASLACDPFGVVITATGGSNGGGNGGGCGRPRGS